MTLLALAEVVKQDVEEINTLPATRERHLAYRLVRVEGEERFKVEQRQQNPDVLLKTCVFEVMDGKKVRVQPPAPTETFCVSICWDTTNDCCVYQIDDITVALWEISKRALEVLFFE